MQSVYKKGDFQAISPVEGGLGGIPERLTSQTLPFQTPSQG